MNHNYSLDKLAKSEPDQTGELVQEFKIAVTGYDGDLDLFQVALERLVEDLAAETGVKVELFS